MNFFFTSIVIFVEVARVLSQLYYFCDKSVLGHPIVRLFLHDSAVAKADRAPL